MVALRRGRSVSWPLIPNASLSHHRMRLPVRDTRHRLAGAHWGRRVIPRVRRLRWRIPAGSLDARHFGVDKADRLHTTPIPAEMYQFTFLSEERGCVERDFRRLKHAGRCPYGCAGSSGTAGADLATLALLATELPRYRLRPRAGGSVPHRQPLLV